MNYFYDQVKYYIVWTDAQIAPIRVDANICKTMDKSIKFYWRSLTNTGTTRDRLIAEFNNNSSWNYCEPVYSHTDD